MTGQTIAYRRVSSVDQNTARQLEGRTFDREFEDQVSGKDMNRPQLEAMLSHIRAGDTVYVHSIDRLARSMADLLALVQKITKGKGAALEFVKEGLRFTGDRANPMDELMLNLLGAVAQFERSMIRERQAEGIAAAKARGVYKGGKPKLSDSQALELLARVKAGEPKAGIARDFGISRETLYQYVRAAQTVSATPRAYFDKNGKEIPDDAWENEPSAGPLSMSDEELAEFDAEMEELLGGRRASSSA